MADKRRRKKEGTKPKRTTLTEDQRTERRKADAALVAGWGTFLLGLAALFNTLWGKF